jgi:subtilase family serine protease
MSVDLSITSILAPTTGILGENLLFEWTVSNNGDTEAAVEGYDAVYLSNDGVLDSSDEFIVESYTGWFGPLAGGGSYTITQEITMPTTVLGNFYLLFVADAFDTELETNETNNVEVVPFEINAPDLVVSAATSPVSTDLGKSIDVSWTVTNQGTVVAPAAWFDFVFISSDQILDSDDISVSSFWSGDNTPLSAGASYTVTQTITIPGTIIGSQYLLFAADGNDYQGETNESNNIKAVAINIAVPTVVGFLSAVNGTANGNLSPTDTNNPTRQGSFSDDYTLTNLIVGTEIILNLSALFDAYLQLINADTQQVILSNDDSGLGYDSQIIFIPVSGVNYVVRATSYNNSEVGDYTLSASTISSDLVVSAATTPTIATLGEAVQVSWTVTNQGTTAALLDWYDNVYISTDQVLDASDTYISGFLISTNTPLAAGTSYTETQTVVLPATVSGDRYLLFIIDAYNLQFEANEVNNIFIKPISLLALDLLVSDVSVPASAILGATIPVSWTVVNQGNGSTLVKWYDYVYVSSDAILDPSDTFVAGEYIDTQSPLATGNSYSITRDITLPTSMGDYYLLFVADGSNAQLEVNETNNLRAIPINLSGPDLVVSNISAPVEALTGQQVEIIWTVTNQGSVDATGTWTDSVSLSDDQQIWNVRKAGDFSFTGTIAAGQSIERRQFISIPQDLNGNYRVIVSTNSSSPLIEDRSNNIVIDDSIINIQLSPFPNLKVTNIAAPLTAFSRKETVIEWTVTNTGTGPTSSPYWTDSVWLSLDNVLDAGRNGDFLLGEVTNASDLNAGESYTNNLTATLPRDAVGNYYFIVQADSRSGVFELNNENDNISIGGPTDISPSPVPDLQITSVNAPIRTFSGQKMSLNYTVTNNGSGIVPLSENEWSEYVYMSDDMVLDANDRLVGTLYRDTYSVSSYFYYDSNGSLRKGINVFDQPEFRPTPGNSYTATQEITLPVGVSGDFYFLVQFDAANQVSEGVFESNNTGFNPTPTYINLTPPPDLEVDSVIIPATALASRGLTINYRVTNYGATETPNYNWMDAVYLSIDNQLDSSTDLFLGNSYHYGAIAAGDSYDASASFILPNGLEGNYYVFVKTDQANDVFELNNDNNQGYSQNTVEVLSRPADLVVTTVGSSALADAGKSTRVNWTVLNQGIGDTVVEGWNDKLYISTDSIFDTNDILLGSFSQNGLLNANDSYSRSELVTIPFELFGNYSLIMVADADKGVYEGANEGNNTSVQAIAISRQTPDLQVTQISAPVTGASGKGFTVGWTAQNLGLGQTNTNYWYDTVYLSTDSIISNNDIKLGQFLRSDILEPSVQYQASQTFTLPIDLAGSFNVLIQTDSGNAVIEGDLENNNIAATFIPTTVTLSATPDLKVQSVDAPLTAISSQSFALTWTVKNDGAETGDLRWYDAFYLSRDQIFDRRSDVYIGSESHSGGLGAGQSYNQTQSFQIPRGLSGSYYVFGVTDSGNSIYERSGEQNNVNYDGNSVQIGLPPPADLLVSSITAPTEGISGKPAIINYTVTNQGANAALGRWSDLVYLSKDAQWDAGDTLVGRVSHSGDVAPGGSYSETLTTNLPGVVVGNYHVIVRTDTRDEVLESSESNNIGASTNTFTVDAEQLKLGVSTTGTLGQGQTAVYYRIEVGAGETLRVKLDSQSDSVENELYIRYGEMPTRSQFDVGFSEPFAADQEVIVPTTRAGTYYVLAYGNTAYASSDFTIQAEALDFSILGIGKKHGSNLGQVTTTITGAEFTPDSIVKLIATDGSERSATKVWWKSSTELWATFDLKGLETGLYDVKVADNGKTAILNDSFTVNNSPVGKVEVNLNTPSAIRAGQVGTVTVAYQNTGETDVIAPVIQLTAENAELSRSIDAGFGGNSIDVLGISSEGPAGILSPGEIGYLNFRFKPTALPGESVNFGITTLEANDELIDLASIKDSSRPQGIDPTAWDIIWQNFSNGIGTTVRS